MVGGGRLTRLKLSYNNLIAIPAELGFLKNLQDLQLTHNQLMVRARMCLLRNASSSPIYTSVHALHEPLRSISHESCRKMQENRRVD
jgi:hypothetical protein